MRNPRPSFFIVHPSLTLDRRPSLFIFHCSLFILLSLFILHSSFFITGCSSSTKPKTGSLSGRVILVNDTGDPSLDPVDFSGVTVALYELAVLDTTIVRINQEYPQIGVQISQETEFDHRLQNPVRVVTTDPDGSYSFDKVTLGTYNLVALKPGWGVRYCYGFTVSEVGLDALESLSIVELYPETELSGSVMEYMEFLPHHSYVINNDTILVGGCRFHGDTRVMVSSGSNLNISERIDFSRSDTFWRITSLDGMYAAEKKEGITPFNKLSLDFIANPKECKNMILSNAVSGLSAGQSQTSFNNIIIRKTASSALVLNSNQAIVSNCLIYDSIGKGIVAYNIAEIVKSMFVRNHESCMLHQADATVVDSYFFGSYLGIRSFLDPQIIRYNCFDQNDVAIAPSASSPTIEFNNFFDNKRDIELNRGGVATDPGYCSPNIQRNNFLGNKFYIHLRGVNSVYADGYIPFTGVNTNQHYPNNYWKAAILANHIYDSNFPSSGVSFTVSYTPRSSFPVKGTGIRG